MVLSIYEDEELKSLFLEYKEKINSKSIDNEFVEKFFSWINNTKECCFSDIDNEIQKLYEFLILYIYKKELQQYYQYSTIHSIMVDLCGYDLFEKSKYNDEYIRSMSKNKVEELYNLALSNMQNLIFGFDNIVPDKLSEELNFKQYLDDYEKFRNNILKKYAYHPDIVKELRIEEGENIYGRTRKQFKFI